MSWLDGLSHRIRTLLAPNRHARELAEEVKFHLEMDAMHDGDTNQGRRRFGNRAYHREEVRESTWLRFVDRVTQDFSSAWRSLRRTPGIVAVVATTLALGIGINAMAFSLLDTLYLSPPGGVSHPENLRRYWVEHTRTHDGVPFHSRNLGYPIYRIVAELADRPENVTVYMASERQLGRGLDGPTVQMVWAQENYFDVLGIRLTMGRTFTAAENQLGSGAPVAIVSEAFRQRHLADRPAPLGTTIDLEQEQYTIIGVMAPDFTGLDLQPAEVWIPIGNLPVQRGSDPWWLTRYAGYFQVVERISTPGTPAAAVEARATDALRRYNRETRGATADTLSRIQLGPIQAAQTPGKLDTSVLISTRLTGVAALILLIALANVVNLLLGRAVARRRELSTRLALGLLRPRLVWILTLEAVMIASIGGAAATLAGWAGGTMLRTLLLPEINWARSAFDWRVGVVTLGLTLGAGLVAGLIPALQASRPGPTSAMERLSTGDRHRSRLQNGLVIAQVALATVLLTGAALTLRSLHNVTSLDLGYDVETLVFGSVSFIKGQAPPNPVVDTRLESAVTRLTNRPGILGVARSSMAPMSGIGILSLFTGADSMGSFPVSPVHLRVSPSFFDVTGLAIQQGRGFIDDAGAETTGEVVVNAAMARMIWPNANPLGQCIQFVSRDRPCYPVVGVVESGRMTYVIEGEDKPQYYLSIRDPLAEGPARTIVVRTYPDKIAAAEAELRTALSAELPGGVPEVSSMTEDLGPQYRPWRLGAALLSGVGLLAVIVVLLGIYSTVSYGVARRTREFGIRMALGAQRQAVTRQVVTSGLRVVMVGLIIGTAITLAAGRLIRAILYGVEPDDPATLVVVSAGLLIVAGLAALKPARTASRIEPAITLRTD